MKVEARGSVAECQRYHKLMLQYQDFYRMRIGSVPLTLESGQLCTQQLGSLNIAMEHDKAAGEAVWALYETQKKLCELCNCLEYTITFLTQNFVCENEDDLQDTFGKLNIAKVRDYLRRLGPEVVQVRRRIMAKVERG